MNRTVLTLAACSLFLAATMADAQPPGRRPGGPGGPGGGFGFGFGGPGQPQSALDLIGREPVQKELGLNEDQIAKVNEMNDAIRDERRSAFGQTNFGDFQNLSQEERQQRFQEMQAKAAETRKKIDEKFKPMLSEILTEEQEKRLDQIVLQVAGVPALLEADLQKKLGLSKDQTDKLAAINKEYTDKRAELMPQGFGGRGPGGGGPGGPGGPGNFQETFSKLRELGETRDKDMLAVLTPEQKAKYDEAKGKEFDVASLRSFGGRGPGGPGGGGPGGRPGGEGRPGGAPGSGRPRPPQTNNQ